MATYSYKCPNCSGPLTYKPDLGRLKCDYCGSAFTLEEIDEYIKNNPDKEIRIEEEHGHDNNEKSGQDELKSYTCANCGAEVVTSSTTLTTFCYYCHNPVVLTDRTLGEFKPDKLIPFAIDKKKAEEILLDWVRKKRYVKRDFYSQTQLEKISGMYLPYWSTDTTFNIKLNGEGDKINMYTTGDTEYIENSTFRIERKGDCEIQNISKLAYSKIDESLIDSITPYMFEDLKDFKNYYLNGFFSETYDKTFDQLKNDLDKDAKSYAKNAVRNDLSEYTSYSLSEETYDIIDYSKNYLLLPAWILTYDYLGKKYVYAINGQSGKAYGNLPIDNKLLIKDALIAALIVFVMCILGGRFIW